MKRIAILASADGLNADRLVEEFHDGNRVRIDIVLTDHEDAGVIKRLEHRGVPVTFFPRKVWDEQPVQITELLKAREIDLVVLDGFSQPVPELMASRFAGRLLKVEVTHTGPDTLTLTASLSDDEAGMIIDEVFNTADDKRAETDLVAEFYRKAVYEALHKLPVANNTDTKTESVSDTQVPPPVPVSTDREWADRLGVQYNPEKVAEVPPPVPVGHVRTYVTQQNPQQPAPQSPQSPQDMPPMPPTYLLWSVLALVLCCMIPGIVAVIFSAQVSSRYYRGDIEGSRRASRMAEIWIIVSFVLGVLSATLYLPMMLIR
ncbi:MAG: CD225/dispanin family protein [Muribaculaceae bacterium]|nr:CD225/dispanin family protein [Muribaculaceae bacterium]